MAELKRIVIMAGGTGGHVFPALAVAKELHAQGVEVHWLGTLKGIENELVVKAVDFHTFMKPTAKPKKAPRKKNEEPIEQVELAQVSSEKPGDVSSDEIETDPVDNLPHFLSSAYIAKTSGRHYRWEE